MNVEIMVPEVSASISSENHSCTQKSLKLSGTLKNRTGEIRSFLRQMEHFLTSLSITSWNCELTGLSGVGGGITLQMKPLENSENMVDLFESYLKKPRKRKSKSGKISRDLK